MSDYWKAFIAGMIWTALEGGAGILAAYATTLDSPIAKAAIGAAIAVAIFAAKTLKLGFPMVDDDSLEDEEGEKDE